MINLAPVTHMSKVGPKSDPRRVEACAGLTKMPIPTFARRPFQFTPVTTTKTGAANWVKVMSQRLKVQEIVMQMHEKNLVLVNILRDIVENETDCDMCMDDDDEEFWRKLNDRAVRRAEIVGEIKHFLRRENLAMQVSA